jgi:GT2 family glycosyltransferase
MNLDRTALPEIGIVVPTLGTRSTFLMECLRSIRENESCHIVLVRPIDCEQLDVETDDLVDQVVDDPKQGLAAAINTGMRAMPTSVQLVSWLGDDDRLRADALDTAASVLRNSPDVVLVFGRCQYIDGEGESVWLNKSGRWTVPLLMFGPQLIPQPGSLFRKSSFDSLAGLDEKLKWAFDLDLLIRLRKLGKLRFIRHTLADFRWHEGSLSVGSRKGSVLEASEVRVSHLPQPLARLSFIWEPFVRFVILKAGERLSNRE